VAKDLAEALQEVGQEVLDKFARDAVEHMRATHPYQDRTYMLTDTTDWQPLPEGGVVVVAAQDYASFVELGTGRARAYPFFLPAIQAAAESNGLELPPLETILSFGG
jgi:hypothetical protein